MVNHIERMDENDLDKRVYRDETAGNQPDENWIELLRKCLAEKNVNLGGVRRTMHNISEWWEFMREYGCGVGPGDKLFQ